MSEEKRVTSNINLEDAKIIFKNFAGRAGEFNDEGNRNFGVLIPDDLVDALIEDGWRVKFLRPREDDPEQYAQPWLPVKVKFGQIPPIVVLITSRGKCRLNEDTIDQLDWSIIKTCDVIIRPYNYPDVKGRPAGVSAYLKAIYATIQEDEFAGKYAGIPDLDGGFEDGN